MIATYSTILVFELNLFGAEQTIWSLPENINGISSLSSLIFHGSSQFADSQEHL